jgi:hypothetical protein
VLRGKDIIQGFSEGVVSMRERGSHLGLGSNEARAAKVDDPP